MLGERDLPAAELGQRQVRDYVLGAEDRRAVSWLGTTSPFNITAEATTLGPFTEAEELIGGWALMECRDLEEAVEWVKRFVSVLGEGEVRVRPAESVWINGEYGPE